MKRESLITKLVAFMLCVMMVVGCLPVGVFAADTTDWESDIDVVEPSVGSQENPAEAVFGDNAAEEGATEYYWVYTEDHDCVMVLTSAADITVNGTVYAVEEGADEVTVELAVATGDEISISSLSFTLGYKSGSCAMHAVYLGNQENTVTNVGTMYYNGYFSGTTMTVSGEGDFSVVYDGETIAAVDGVVSTAVSTANPRMPVEFSIIGDGDYTITFAYPAGSQNNPAVAYLGDNTATIEAGSQGYYFTYTALCDSKLVVTIAAADDAGWTYVINNVTAGTYGDTQWSDSDPVVNPATIELAAGEEIQIIVNTYDSENPYTAPAGTITMDLEQVSGVCANCAIFLGQMENTVTNAGTMYYRGYFSGTVMTVSGEGDYNVIYNGETIAAVDGDVSTAVSSSNPRMPIVFAIEGDGDYTVSFAYPEGSSSNPAAAQLGDNVAAIEAGNAQGYFFNYIAENDGDLVVTISADTGWTYTINNMTTYEYGDAQWSDSDPVVNPATVTVAAGDEIQIVVNTYDPSDEWNNPAGTITVNLAYAPDGPIEDAELKFTTKGLSFQEFIGVQPVMTKSVADTYDKVYIEVEHTAWNKTKQAFETTTEIIEGGVYATKYYRFTKKIMAWAMTEEITITLYAEKEGVTYIGESFTTSVETMALEKLAQYASSNTKACAALANMLTYGSKLQQQQSYNTNNLPDANLGTYAQYVTTTIPSVNATNVIGEAGTVNVNVNNLSMQAQVEIQLAFKQTTDLTGYELRYSVGGTSYTMAVDDFAVLSGYNFAKIAVKASNMRETYTIALYDIETGEAVTAVYNVSVEGYATNKLGVNDATDALIYALMNYGDAIAAL